MRRNPTGAEAKLWPHLRDHRFSGCKFRRQEPIGDFIADFVCFAPRVPVEVDGSQHIDSQADARRDAWFRSQGFAIVRVWNTDVLNDIESVLDAIAAALKAHPVQVGPSARGTSDRRYWIGKP